jgi:hypothetical protein
MIDRLRQMASTALQQVSVVLSPTPAVVVVPGQNTRADLIEIKVNGIDDAKEQAVWLTKGLDRSQPATAVRLIDCTSDHLKNIVMNKPNLSADYRHVIEAILEDRGDAIDPIDDPLADPHSDVTL